MRSFKFVILALLIILGAGIGAVASSFVFIGLGFLTGVIGMCNTAPDWLNTVFYPVAFVGVIVGAIFSGWLSFALYNDACTTSA